MQSGSVGLMMCGAREDYGPRLSYFAPCLVCVFVLSLDKILERGLFSFYSPPPRSRAAPCWLNVFVRAPSLRPPAEIGMALLLVGTSPGQH